jgi:hypothetical protein
MNAIAELNLEVSRLEGEQPNSTKYEVLTGFAKAPTGADLESTPVP